MTDFHLLYIKYDTHNLCDFLRIILHKNTILKVHKNFHTTFEGNEAINGKIM